MRGKKKKKKRGDALREPRPCPRMPQARKPPGPPAPTKPRGEAGGRSEPRAGRSSKGLSGRSPCQGAAGSRHAAGLYRPLPGMPRAPRARTLTDAGNPGSGSAVAAARPGTAPAFREPRRACEREASGAQGACAARRTIPGRRWEEGLRDSHRLPSSRRRGCRAPRLTAPLDLVQSAALSVERSGRALRSGLAL